MTQGMLFDVPVKPSRRKKPAPVIDYWEDDDLVYHGWTCRPVEPPPISDRKILSMFDTSGTWSQPYRDAGYPVYQLDIENDMPCDVFDINIEWFDDFDLHGIWGILAALPCTEFAVSGSQWWPEKDADGRTEKAVQLAKQTLSIIEYLRPAWWALENPVGRLRKLVPELAPFGPWWFEPYYFGDPYTKKTGLWGQFNRELFVCPVPPHEGSKMHKVPPGPDQKYLRSITPSGFSRAFFDANP